MDIISYLVRNRLKIIYQSSTETKYVKGDSCHEYIWIFYYISVFSLHYKKFNKLFQLVSFAHSSFSVSFV
uniref:Putative ovule protein n=1 Tax=Solanum chacoense TaxID=4108 RepID=A0A0V0GRM2_SOLCH